MKVLVEKHEPVDTILTGLASIVMEKYHYIPGWFEKLEDGTYQFHHMNALPNELIEAVKTLQEPQTPEKP